jgi:hypothetical protein
VASYLGIYSDKKRASRQSSERHLAGSDKRASSVLIRACQRVGSRFDLPPKTEHYLKSELSKPQLDWHIDLLNRRSGNTSDSHPFSILHHLMRLSQHPALVPRFEPTTAEDAIRSCPKLQSVTECLKEIETKSEKVLIFTRSIDMQQLLALTLEHVFGFQVHIVNGATGRYKTGNYILLALNANPLHTSNRNLSFRFSAGSGGNWDDQILEFVDSLPVRRGVLDSCIVLFSFWAECPYPA